MIAADHDPRFSAIAGFHPRLECAPNSYLGSDLQRSVEKSTWKLMLARSTFVYAARFSSADNAMMGFEPLFPQSANRYSLVLNSPIVFHDPDGHIPCSSLTGWISNNTTRLVTHTLCIGAEGTAVLVGGAIAIANLNPALGEVALGGAADVTSELKGL